MSTAFKEREGERTQCWSERRTGMCCDDGLTKSTSIAMSPVDWTVSDVASYFAAVGFPEQAVAFKAQVGL